MTFHLFRRLGAVAGLLLWVANAALAQGQQVVAMCSTDQSWCELAAKDFQAQTGIKVLQVRKATGEALAQIRAEAANPKTDLWWGGTGDPFLQAAELGLLDPYRPAYLNDLQAWSVRQYAMSGNLVGGFYTSAIGFGWNEDVQHRAPHQVRLREVRQGGRAQAPDRALGKGSALAAALSADRAFNACRRCGHRRRRGRAGCSRFR